MTIRLLAIAACAACKGSDSPRPLPAPPEIHATVAAHPADLAEAIRKASLEPPPERIAPIWDAACPDVGVFTLAIGCMPMPHARFRTWLGRPQLVLSSKTPADCNPNHGPTSDDTQTIVVVELLPGVGESVACGRAIAVRTELQWPNGKDAWTMAGSAVVTVGTGALDRNAHLAGSLTIEGYGRGTFDADACPDDDYAHLPVVAAKPPGPRLAFALARHRHPNAALVAHLSPHPELHVTVLSLSVVDDAPAGVDPCDVRANDRLGMLLLAVGETSRKLAGTVQPIVASLMPDLDDVAYGWVRYDTLPTTPGEHVRGQIAIDSPNILLSGPLDAIVCGVVR
ncbi:MAG: hypothetical protein NT062_19105 [Proteobacteria bacterium]|nr:hypothetical protein [Pseudomonadota bacterium]